MRHSYILFLACTGLRLVGGGLGSLLGEIVRSEACISDIGFWAIVAGTKKNDPDYSRSPRS